MFILNNIVYEYILFEKKGKEDRGAMGKLIAASRMRRHAGERRISRCIFRDSGRKLLVLGGANFPDKYPWEGGTKTWWSTLYSYDLQTGKWTVYDDFLDRPLAYGVSISLPEGLLCIGGCDRTQCSDNVFLIKKEEDSFVIDSVSYPSLPVPLGECNGGNG